MSYIEGVGRNQVVLFPEKIDDYIREENPVQFLDAFVDSLDLRALGFNHTQPGETGRPPYHPADMLKLYLWGYLNRVRSSRSLEKESHRNLEVMWLLKKLAPDFKTIADFRKDNKGSIKKVCREFTLLCKHLELFGGELIAIDSSKFRAVNSKKRNFNRAKLEKRIKEIEESIERYFRELEDNDDKEASVQAVKAEELKAKLQWLKEKGEEYRALLKRLVDSGETQISLTDPDSRAMVNNQRVEVCYNVQVTVDSKNKLILDHEVTNEGTDYDYLSKMALRAKKTLGVEKLEVTADKGYYDAEEIKECVDQGIIPYIPEKDSRKYAGRDFAEAPFPEKAFRYEKEKDCYTCPVGSELTFRGKQGQHGRVMKIYRSEKCLGCALRSRCTTHPRGRTIFRWEYEEILEDMRQRVESNKTKVKTRQWLSEHPFGTIKRTWNQGYMLMKGLDKVRGEASLTVIAYNMKRAINILGVQELISAVRWCPAAVPSY